MRRMSPLRPERPERPVRRMRLLDVLPRRLPRHSSLPRPPPRRLPVAERLLPRAPPLAASWAFTSCWVTTFGGIDVTITALILSPGRKSDTLRGLAGAVDLDAALVDFAL